MIEAVTYHSTNAKPDSVWMAYVIMPNGQRWNVPSYGSTEKEAVDKIVVLWESERAKLKLSQNGSLNDPAAFSASGQDGSSDGQSSRGLKPGMVWVINKTTREKKVVTPEVAEGMIAFGEWFKGGPRSK